MMDFFFFFCNFSYELYDFASHKAHFDGQLSQSHVGWFQPVYPQPQLDHFAAIIYGNNEEHECCKRRSHYSRLNFLAIASSLSSVLSMIYRIPHGFLLSLLHACFQDIAFNLLLLPSVKRQWAQVDSWHL